MGGLVDPDLTLFGARRDGRLVGIGALRRIDAGHGELKSMHTAEEARGAGVGRAMLDHLLAEARARGYRRVSLETGTTRGFRPGAHPPFGGYPPGPFTAFLALAL